MDWPSNKWYGIRGSCGLDQIQNFKRPTWVSLNKYSIYLNKRNFEANDVELKGSLQHN